MILHKKGAGADSVIPFSGGAIKAFIVRYATTVFYNNTDGTYGTCGRDDIATFSDIISAYQLGSYHVYTLEKSGYYIGTFDTIKSPTYMSAGDTVRDSNGAQAIMYLGETNPFA